MSIFILWLEVLFSEGGTESSSSSFHTFAQLCRRHPTVQKVKSFLCCFPRLRQCSVFFWGMKIGTGTIETRRETCSTTFHDHKDGYCLFKQVITCTLTPSLLQCHIWEKARRVLIRMTPHTFECGLVWVCNTSARNFRCISFCGFLPFFLLPLCPFALSSSFVEWNYLTRGYARSAK